MLNFKNVFNAIVLIVKNAMNSIKAFFVIISKVLEGDFNGAVDAWKEALGKNVGTQSRSTLIPASWQASTNFMKSLVSPYASSREKKSRI